MVVKLGQRQAAMWRAMEETVLVSLSAPPTSLPFTPPSPSQSSILHDLPFPVLRLIAQFCYPLPRTFNASIVWFIAPECKCASPPSILVPSLMYIGIRTYNPLHALAPASLRPALRSTAPGVTHFPSAILSLCSLPYFASVPRILRPPHPRHHSVRLVLLYRWTTTKAPGVGIGIAQEAEVLDATRYPFLVKAPTMEQPLFSASITSSAPPPRLHFRHLLCAVAPAPHLLRLGPAPL
ncbi:hypothetical protein B0H11DRAFT_2296456 [Mycena galericulata]|nr:hypothetical protein B0H11DRAFT_2296456 [Mycena galericulata]